ncbi:MAG TPA: thioredoxin domain-containing protein [Geminicoccaceae bacterium]|nr:thioredoxin domain-containing protein [Geminicoccaceae bacterium]
MANRLSAATSPYLLQHQDNPVDWREWGPEALAEAKARDVPILLSVGYAACHWCHVMAHESFESPEIAAQMNRDFVSIKVDREERPDLDSIYQQALALLGQQGGWPLTMFLTPDGEPFWGGTYFPPEPRWGRAGFPQVLEQIANLWRNERHKVDGNREALARALGRLARPEAGDGLPPELAIGAARQIAEQFDTIHGGTSGAPKFPQAPMLELLWRASLVTGERTLARRVLHTLARMSQGGIYDHLGGGYSRYSVDAYWLVPHFEKMLYDNAQLLHLLGEAWAATREPLYRERAEETVAWLEREMLVDGAFASSLDADSEGEEGRFYVWDAAEIDVLLGADAGAFKLAYGVTAAGNWEGRNVLNRLHEQGLPPPEEAALLARCRTRLLEARERRPRPGRDDKVLADWNGMMIQALASASLRFDRPDWLQLARTAFAAVVERLGEGDRLHHSWRAGRRLPMAFIDDYAEMARAALGLFEQTGEAAYLERAEAWTARIEADYRDPEGGWFTAPADAGLIVRPKSAHDGPSPSGIAVLLHVLVELWCLTGKGEYADRAEALVRAFAGEVRRNPYAHTALLSGVIFMAEPVQVVLVGRPGNPDWQSLQDVVAAAPVASLVLVPAPDRSALPAGHPAAGKPMVGDRATAYICTGQTCRPPVTEPEALATELRSVHARQH